MQFNDMLNKGRTVEKTIAVCQAADTEVIRSVQMAVGESKASFKLFGDEMIINQLLDAEQLKGNDRIEVIHVPSEEQAVSAAVNCAASGEAHIIMKGLIATPVILKEILKKEYGLATNRKLSHLAIFNVPAYHKMLMVTDAGMNINPSLQEKVDIINNALMTARQLGYHQPKVAVISAIELVNPKMESTVEAALITQMNRRGQIKGGIIDGPMALDNALSKEAAEHKGLQSEVAGDADILIMPQIEAGNVLYKSLTYMAKADVASMVVGAKIPIILSSRADQSKDKFHSILLALSAI